MTFGDPCGCPIIPQWFSGGPDDLRPQYLKDQVLDALDDSQLLVAVTDPTNCYSRATHRLLFEFHFTAPAYTSHSQKHGAITQIVVGYVWMRLATNVTCSHARVVSTTLLAPRHLAFEFPVRQYGRSSNRGCSHSSSLTWASFSPNVERSSRPPIWQPPAAVGKGCPASGSGAWLGPLLLPGDHRTAEYNEVGISPEVP